MTYEQRIAIISEWFKLDIVPRFSMPKDIDPKVAAKDAIEAVNSSIHSKSEDLTPILATALKKLTTGARSRTLPTTKDFKDAAAMASETHRAGATAPTQDTLNTYHLTAKRIRSGEAVGQCWFQNTMREELLRNTDLTEADLALYDLAIAAHTQ